MDKFKNTNRYFNNVFALDNQEFSNFTTEIYPKLTYLKLI